MSARLHAFQDCWPHHERGDDSRGGTAIRERKRLWKVYGVGRWRKLKGEAAIQFHDGTMAHAEIHWYEAHGIGAKEYKIKRILD